MNGTDLELLARYTRQKAEDAFTELVQRHLNLVYSAAVRQVHSPQLAEEVAQSTFIKLAQNAHQLTPGTVLAAWLYQVAHREAINLGLREARRKLREQIATEMNAMNANADGWLQIEPMLDEAMLALEDMDRAAILLRFFENKSLSEVGQALGGSENAAQKRVTRAIERLREFFTRRGVALDTSGLVAAISANAVQAAPVGLVTSISSAAILAGSALSAATAITATKVVLMTTVQKVLIGASVALLGLGVFEARRASVLQTQLQLLKSQQEPMGISIQQLQEERDNLSKQMAAVVAQNAQLQRDQSELPKLRREVRRLSDELRQQLAAGSNAKVQPEQAPLSSAQEYYERAMRHFNNREYEAELADLNKAIEMDPNLTEACFQRANLYSMYLPKEYGGYEKAVADFSRVLELKPNNYSARHNRALGYEDLRQYDNAIADYTRLIEGDTDFSRLANKDLSLAMDYHYRGRAYQWYKKDYAKAVVDYNQALRLDPNLEGVHLHRGQCYEALGQPDKAQEDFAIEKPH